MPCSLAGLHPSYWILRPVRSSLKLIHRHRPRKQCHRLSHSNTLLRWTCCPPSKRRRFNAQTQRVPRHKHAFGHTQLPSPASPSHHLRGKPHRTCTARRTAEPTIRMLSFRYPSLTVHAHDPILPVFAKPPIVMLAGPSTMLTLAVFARAFTQEA